MHFPQQPRRFTNNVIQFPQVPKPGPSLPVKCQCNLCETGEFSMHIAKIKTMIELSEFDADRRSARRAA